MAKKKSGSLKEVVQSVESSVGKTLKGSNKNITRKKKATKLAEAVRERRENPLSLVGLLNQKLSASVIENMNAPRLVNRTGTFANSVVVTNIIVGKRGGLTVEYTYQKQPYGVFDRAEGGRLPWATPQRDPKKLIELSIRELAAQQTLGRFTFSAQ